MRIIGQILGILLKIIIIVLVMTVTFTVSLVLLSGPYSEPPEVIPEPPPTFEALIPQGSRNDSTAVVSVLIGEEIVELPLEIYLIGAVSAEMPASFELEALKAQAVAARTNVLYRMHVMPKLRHPNAQICTDYTCCMAYSDDEDLHERWGEDYIRYITRVIGAVLDTDGVYISYNGEPILAAFHSSSAGKTEASGNVWVTDLPYLASVDSPETSELVPGFITTVQKTKQDFKDKIANVRPDAVFGANESSWITDITYTDSGRILELTIGGAVFRGTELRSMFNLRSTLISFEWIEGDIVFTVTGNGHGVGLSQYGANAMAMEKNDYRSILYHYYTDVELMPP